LLWNIGYVCLGFKGSIAAKRKVLGILIDYQQVNYQKVNQRPVL